MTIGQAYMLCLGIFRLGHEDEGHFFTLLRMNYASQRRQM